jgi:hypothetical protein
MWKFDGNYWTWMSGSNGRNQEGQYGIQGKSSKSNMPSSRQSALGWTNLYGNLWLFGGTRSGKTDVYSDVKFLYEMNDLWIYNGKIGGGYREVLQQTKLVPMVTKEQDRPPRSWSKIGG